MALCANGRGFGRTQVLEADDLGYIAAAIHVRLAWTVARLAAMLVAFQKRRVGRTGKVLVPDFLVAGLANIRVRITGRLGIRNQGGSLRLGRFLLRFVPTCTPGWRRETEFRFAIRLPDTLLLAQVKHKHA